MPPSKQPQTTGTLDDLGTASLAARRLLEEAKQNGKAPESKPLTMEAIQEAMNRTIQETIAPLIGARFGVEAGTKIAQTLFQAPEPVPSSPNRRNVEEPSINVTEIVRAGIEGRKTDQEFIDKLMAARFEAELRAVEEARKGSERNDNYWQTLLTVMQQNHEKEMELVKAIYQAKEEARQQGDPVTAQLTGTLVNLLSGLLQQRLTAESRDPLEEALARAEAWERLRSRFGGGNSAVATKELRLLEMQHELNMQRLNVELQKWREEREQQRQEREERAKQFENLAKVITGALGMLPSLLQQRTGYQGPPPPAGAPMPEPPASPSPDFTFRPPASNATLEV